MWSVDKTGRYVAMKSIVFNERLGVRFRRD